MTTIFNGGFNDSDSGKIDFFQSIKKKRVKSLNGSCNNQTNLNDFEKHIRILEAASGSFVCATCCINDDKNGSTGDYYSTWNGSEFSQHLNACHKDQDEYLCLYCGVYLPKPAESLEDHINYHFLDNPHSHTTYECPLCPFSSNLCRFFSSHMESKHSEELANATSDQLSCMHCQSPQSNILALVCHYSSNVRMLVHCQTVGCTVKSASLSSMQDHVKRKHPNHDMGLLSSTQMLCTLKGARLQAATSPVASSRLGQLFPDRILDPLFSGLFNSNSDLAQQHKSLKTRRQIYCLRCPYCHLSTIKWEKFTQHQALCTKCERGEYHYQLYHCSICRAVSTEKEIIKEHVQIEHADGEACVLSEDVSVTLIHPERLDNNSDRLLNGDSLKRNLSDLGELSDLNSHKRQRLLDQESDYSHRSDEAVIISSKPGSGESNTAEYEWVSFPFDEDAFRVNFYGRPDLECLVEKMKKFCAYTIKILGKENHRRVPECPECHKVFLHGLGDFKRHLMSVHLEMPREHLKDVLRYTHLPKGEEKFQELQEQLAMRNVKPRFIEPGKKKIPLPYSLHVLRKLTGHLSRETQEYLVQKMRTYSNLFVILDTSDGNRKYRCYHCSYSSPHALADVRKHILGAHCGISTKHFRFCLQSSRLDPTEFTLLTEDKLMRLAKEFNKRKSSQLISGGTSLYNQYLSDDFAASSSSLPTDSFGQSYSFPDLQTNEDSTSEVDNSAANYSSFNFSNSFPALNDPVDPGYSSTPRSNSYQSGSARHNNTTMYRPSTGGRKGSSSLQVDYDQEAVLPLPFAEPVLRQLLSGICTPDQIDDIVEKMKVYSNYPLTRLIRNKKTVAFRCKCMRVFHTAKIPGSSMRPATLADSRRHIMGVHARISHELLTICCQASRISRENGYELYPDDMLMKLATERPVKAVYLNNPPDEEQNMDEESFDDSVVHIKTEAQSHVENEIIRPKKSTYDSSMTAHSHDAVDGETCEEHLRMYNPLANYNSEDPNSIERFIDLPYSLPALMKLTEGYCTDVYRPILREKMDIYSSYKVYVVRRGVKRYFCCSGCPASSPHGMGDIRKHILGVHAKVPERYKAAAMHCSRLSREDNGLLPDRMLLHLSQMKWKGTVIKPLAELSDSELEVALTGGIQRKSSFLNTSIASTSNKSTPSPFSSISMVGKNGTLIGQSSSAKSPTKKLMTLPPSESEEMFDQEDCVDPNAIGVNQTVNKNIEIPPEMYICKVKGNWGETQYSCSLCKHVSHHIGNIRGHIVCDHLGIPRHRCSICGALFNLKNELSTHHTNYHFGILFRPCQYSPYRHAMSHVKIINNKSPSKSSLHIPLSNRDSPNPQNEPPEISCQEIKDEQDVDNSEDQDYIEEEEEEQDSHANNSILLPNSLDKPLHPANKEDCFVTRRKGGYGQVTFHCSVCSGSSTSLASIKSHIAQYHVGVYPFKCHLCNTSFWKREGLINHFDFIHPNKRPSFATPEDYRTVISEIVVKSKTAKSNGPNLIKKRRLSGRVGHSNSGPMSNAQESVDNNTGIETNDDESENMEEDNDIVITS